MAAFRFRLDPLLEARRQREKAVQRQVAEAERQRLELEEAIRRRQRDLSAARAELRGRLTGALHAEQLRMHAASALHFMRDAQRLVIELAGVRRRLEAIRARLAAAARERRALELLRERRLAAWTARRAALEAAAADDLAIMRWSPTEDAR
jgi:flagellar FliJ protein